MSEIWLHNFLSSECATPISVVELTAFLMFDADESLIYKTVVSAAAHGLVVSVPGGLIQNWPESVDVV